MIVSYVSFAAAVGTADVGTAADADVGADVVEEDA